MIDRRRINQQIRATPVRLIGNDGSQLGIFSLTEALNKAREQELDLIEIAPSAKPPVCKIFDYKKYLFNQEKKEQEALRKTKKVKQKEFRFGPNIGKNDLEFRIKRAREFLTDGNNVKVTVKFRGRENEHPEVGREKIDLFISTLADISEIKEPPKRDRGVLFVNLTPALKNRKEGNKDAKNENNETSRETL